MGRWGLWGSLRLSRVRSRGLYGRRRRSCSWLGNLVVGGIGRSCARGGRGRVGVVRSCCCIAGIGTGCNRMGVVVGGGCSLATGMTVELGSCVLVLGLDMVIVGCSCDPDMTAGCCNLVVDMAVDCSFVVGRSMGLELDFLDSRMSFLCVRLRVVLHIDVVLVSVHFAGGIRAHHRSYRTCWLD